MLVVPATMVGWFHYLLVPPLVFLLFPSTDEVADLGGVSG